ncbi:MAG: ABC transporter substrate-binding protein [Kofleriaceae bacterium]
MRLFLVLLFLAGCGRDAAQPPAPSERGSSSPKPAGLQVVSLTPSATEIMGALGATQLLIGVDDYSTFPPEVAKLPKVGSFLSPNLEAIVRLRPSLVVVDDVHGSAAGALRDAGIETVACPIHGLPDVKSALVTVGRRIGKAEEATRVIAEIDASIEAARATRPAKRPRVLAIIDREAGGLGNLVAAGPGSWLDEMLAVVGGENVLASSGVRYPKISLEEVLRGQPEVILDLSFSARGEGVGAWKAVDVPATKSERVVALSEPYLAAPSPRVKDALAALAKAIAAR